MALAALALLTALPSAIRAHPLAATVTASPTSGPPTTAVQLRGAGYTAAESVQILFDTSVVATATAGSTGQFSARITVPPTASPGPHTIRAVGQRSLATAGAPFLVRTDWNRFHFDAASTGFNPYENVISRATVAGLARLYSHQTGFSILGGAVAVAGGRVFIGSADRQLVPRLFAFDDRPCGLPICQPSWVSTSPAGSLWFNAPAVSGEYVYAGNDDGKLYVWRTPGCGAPTCPPLWVGTTIQYGSSIRGPAVVSGGMVYAAAGHWVYAWSATCGARTCPYKWRGDTGTFDTIDISGPTVASGRIYVGSMDGRLYAFPANGCGMNTCKPLWSGDTGGRIQYSAPAVANGVVYVGSDSGKLLAFNAAGCGRATCKPLWVGPIPGPHKIWIETAPAVANGVVYVGTIHDSRLYAFNARGCGGPTCQPLWRGQMGGVPVEAAPIVANGVVYAGALDGNVYAFDAAGCGQASCLPIWVGTTTPGYNVRVTPAIANGRLYVGGNDSYVHVFGLPSPPATMP